MLRHRELLRAAGMPVPFLHDDVSADLLDLDDVDHAPLTGPSTA
jgi:hypothetical protein